MIKTKEIVFILLVLGICFLAGCRIDYRDVNDKTVERLRHRLIHERFDEIYDESSSIVRAQLTREEFLERIKTATVELKDTDPDLNWRHDERGSPEEGVYRDDNWSSLNLEKNARKVNVQLDWGTDFALCGMLISGDIPEGGNRVFRNCD